MTKKVLFTLAIIFSLFVNVKRVIAVSDPLRVPNNKLGVHVLDPGEVLSAAKLVNNDSQGSWGYVTVPIQASDRDRDKWGLFFKQAKEQKVIPIIRVATVPSGANWDQPNNYDLVDFANFLNDLPWPTKNRYVVIFNEVNRASEYGGFVAPEQYADILANAITIFKERSEDFFILPAGLDNAAPSNHELLNWKTYLTRMAARQPDIFDRLDGWTSHAYPNPAFSGSPYDRSDSSIRSFVADLQFLTRFTKKKLPVFITETGWDMERLKPATVAGYYQTAFAAAWNDPRIVAVTPFLLHAGDGPFMMFSLSDDSRSLVFQALQAQSKVGEPELATPSAAPATIATTMVETKAAGIWDQYQGLLAPFRRSWEVIKQFVFGGTLETKPKKTVVVGNKSYQVEIADTPLSRQRGLSGRSLLAKNQGMLFIFGNPGYHVFWMKDMKFNIDIVWIDGEKVVGVSPAYAAKPFALSTPPSPVRYVLEVNVNSGIKVGDKVSLNL